MFRMNKEFCSHVAELQTQPSRFKSRKRDSLNHSPMFVFYEVTQACDLVCLQCRACAQLRPDPVELSTSESKQLIDQLLTFPEPPRLELTGGDPLKRSDIFELIEYATAGGLTVSITPSATPLVTRAVLRRLCDAGISRMAISMDGANAETHDRTRGVSGSFERSLEILADASSLSVETQINTVLSPRNIDQIEEMAVHFSELDIVLWSVFFLVPVGRGGQLGRLNAEQCEVAFAKLWHESLRQPYRIQTTEAPHYRRYAIQHQLEQRRLGVDASPHTFVPAGVNDGKGIMFVSHSGQIHPSGFLPIVCGMFPSQNVVNVYQESPIFIGLRDANRLEGKCGRCEFRNICGGSRARAYAVTGNIFSQEPDCSYRPPSDGIQTIPNLF